MSNLKKKTVSSIAWSFIDSTFGQGIQFVIGIILARILSPKEFGLIGMITIFIAVSESFINSGFSQALIRKKDCSQTDYSTVFFFNLATGILFFLILFFSASAISDFFNEPELTSIVQVLGVVLIIDSLTIIQRTIRTKRLDFKLQARISIIASLGSGMVAITMAYSGFGVWSLVALQLTRNALNSFFLWYWNRWSPSLIFSKSSFRDLFGFGSKLLISGLIDTLYKNVYYLVIGKFFSAQDLGYFTRATQFKDFPSKNVTNIMSRVTYPVLSQMQDDKIILKAGYKRMIKSIMFLSCVLMIGMASVAEPLIISLLGEKWRVSIIYLQMLSFVGMFYPLHALNLNMLNVLGHSNLFLKLEIIKKSLSIPTIVLGVFFGIKIMIAGMILNTIIAYYLNSYWSGHFINYSTKEQIKDILPSFILAISSGAIVYVIGLFLPFSYLINLTIQVILGSLIVFTICEMIKLDSYIYLKEIVINQYRSFRHGKKK